MLPLILSSLLVGLAASTPQFGTPWGNQGQQGYPGGNPGWQQGGNLQPQISPGGIPRVPKGPGGLRQGTFPIKSPNHPDTFSGSPGVAPGVYCPIFWVDAKPNYNLECVYGNATNVYKDELITNVVVIGPQFDAVVPFYCVRSIVNVTESTSEYTAYDYWMAYYLKGGYDNNNVYHDDRLCYVTEGNVANEDKNTQCFSKLKECDPCWYDSKLSGSCKGMTEIPGLDP